MNTSDPKMGEYKWEYLGQPSGREQHRYFRCRDSGRISICDDSGDRPDYTDDGVLWLDHNRAVQIYRRKDWPRALDCTLPVLCVEVDGLRESFCGPRLEDLLWLIEQGHWSPRNVSITAEVAPILRLFARLGAVEDHLIRTDRRCCPVCGGEGWTDGSAELRRDGREGDTTCIGCDGKGTVPNEQA